MAGSWRVPRLWHAALIALAVCFAFALVPVTAGAVGGATISGTVTLDGAPLAGANIQLYDASTWDLKSETVADANGDYQFVDVAAGDYAIDFLDGAGNYLSVESEYVTVIDASTYTVNGDFVSPVPVVSGNITDASTGGPIWGADVTGYMFDDLVNEWFEVLWASSDEFGDYLVDSTNLLQGDVFRLRFGAWGYVPEYYSDAAQLNAAQDFTWDGLTEFTGVDAALAVASTEVGEINGTVTSDGVPVEGWTVEIYDTTTVWGDTALTDAAGNYSFVNLPASEYEVVVTSPDSALQKTQTRFVNGDVQTVDFSFAAPVPGNVSGTVTLDGAPAQGWEVELWSIDGGTRYAVTDASGAYLFADVPAGDYEVYAHDADYTLEDWQTVNVDGDVVADFAFLTPVPAITGTVTDASTGEPLWDELVTAYIEDSADGIWYEQGYAYTDESGAYELDSNSVAADTPCVVGFEAWRYVGELYDNKSATDFAGATKLTWDGGAPITEIDAALTPAPKNITGTITDAATGLPIEWPSVELRQYDAEAQEWYTVDYEDGDADGVYAFYGVENGAYKVVASAWRYIDAETSEFTFSGSLVTKNLKLSPAPKAVTGRITDASNGVAIQWGAAWVELLEWNAVDEVWEYQGDTNTDKTGNYAFYQLTEGATYKLVASSEDYCTQQSAQFTYKGSTITQNFALKPAKVAVTGTVTDKVTNQPIKWAYVQVYEVNPDQTLTWIESTNANDSGKYEARQLSAGKTYVIGADEQGYEAAKTASFAFTGAVVTKNLQLTPLPKAISGTVTDEVTDAPLGNVEVEIDYFNSDWNEWEYVDWTETNASGDYSFTTESISSNVEYALSFQSQHYFQETYDNIPQGDWANATLVTWNGTDAVTGIDAALKPLPTLAGGKITNAKSGAAVAEASVYLYGYDVQEDYWYDIDAVSTAADGTYKFQWAATDGDKFKVSAEKFAAFAEKTSEPATFAGQALTFNLALDPLPKTVEKVAGTTRFNGSVSIAAEYFDDPAKPGTWPEVAHVVLACGDDRASADPLGASGLSYAYNAPLFLTSSGSVSTEVKTAIKQIAAANGSVTIHIVGGSVSVPDARYAEIVSFVGKAGTVNKDRLLSGGTRYDMSAAIARRMADLDGNAPYAVLIANGQDQSKFFDALALSPIAARNGYPILLVDNTSIPPATQTMINEFKVAGGAKQIIVGGGSKTVPDSTVKKLGATRWAGTTRYSTALVIADKAVSAGWLDYEPTGVAAKLPDALTGGSVVGLQGGVLVLTDGNTLTPETGNWLTAHKSQIANVSCFGGDKSLTPAVRTAIYNKIK